MKWLCLILCLSTSVLFADKAPFASQSDLVADLSDSLLNGIYHHRLNWNRCSNERSVWVEGLGNYRHRDSDSQRREYENWFGGVVGGFNIGLSCDRYLNFFVGGTWGRIDICDEKSFDTDSIFFGVSWERFANLYFYGFTLAGGILTEDRHFGGVREEAQGVFFTPELTWAREINCFCGKSIFTTTLRYAGFFPGDYQHRELLGTLYVKERSIQLFTLRAELATFCIFNVLEPYIGAAGRFQFDGNRVRGHLIQSNESFSDGIHSKIAYGLVGIRSVRRCGCMDVQFNVEGSYDSDKSGRVLGDISLNFAY